MAGWDGSVGTWLLGGRAATRADGIRTGRFWRARAATKAARTCQNSPPVDLVRPSLREGSLTNPASASPGVKSQAKLPPVAFALPVRQEPACAIPFDGLGAATRTGDGALFAERQPDAGQEGRLSAPLTG